MIVLTLFCAYLGTWHPTANVGIAAVLDGSKAWNAAVFMPLVVAIDQLEQGQISRRYYAWFFDPVIRLPHKRNTRDKPMDDVVEDEVEMEIDRI